MVHKLETSPVPGIRRFLWWCSGADQTLLRHFPSEWNKYSAIGASVCSTAILATLSGSYAAITIVSNTILACTVGIAWGLTIFSLDRFLISTIGYEKERAQVARLRTLSKAIPRIILGIFIGIVVSTPVQIKLLEREINQQITVERLKPVAEIEEGIAKKEGELQALQNQLKSTEDQVDKAQQLLTREVSGREGTGLPGLGPVYKQRERVYEDAKLQAAKSREELQPQIIQANAQLYELKSQRDSLLRLQQQYSVSFFTRANALSIISQRDNRILWIRYLITLLFIILEIAPVLTKLLSDQGPYEQLTIDSNVRKAWLDALDTSELKHRSMRTIRTDE